ncbi:acyltransferase [Hankyongella ginsenosidimutans]|uniref:Acyltransferase n=1 Tax=Hankyongella ginsenosidimutans TaxID=1763828 RepID=A0A4D7CBX3_9SPHN|nr:acyltransferase family protein [Hankyongella ginsenosidimutans]QCI79312.1 acyltransferase [Hankyongella ginsenosidimutans]
MMRPEQYSGRPAFDDLFSKGFVGVDFFFVLSGFIICFVHYKDMSRPDRLPRYAWRRLTRVLPTYWVVFVAALAMNLLLQREKATVTAPWLLEQWFMLPPAQLSSARPGPCSSSCCSTRSSPACCSTGGPAWRCWAFGSSPCMACACSMEMSAMRLMIPRG